MELSTLWFILLSVLFAGFFFLEGFDYGVALLMPVIAHNDNERRLVMNSIGPHWDGNEVWMITAFGAMFAAFPVWYAVTLRAFYPVVVLVLAGLIFRGISFEFRNKMPGKGWKNFCDAAFTGGSFIPALAWGMLLTGYAAGLPIDAKTYFQGDLMSVVTLPALCGGILLFGMFVQSGGAFLSLKVEGVIGERGRKAARLLAPAVAVLAVVELLVLAVAGKLSDKPLTIVFAVLGVVVLLCGWWLLNKRAGLAVIFNGLATALWVFAFFAWLFPNAVVSSLGTSLTLANAASGDLTLKLMTIVACCLLPFVLAYQVFSYWLFRKRITVKDLEY